MRIEKRITEKDFKKILNSGTMDEIYDMCDKYTLQELKDMMLTDAGFEIIEPKQLPETNQSK